MYHELVGSGFIVLSICLIYALFVKHNVHHSIKKKLLLGVFFGAVGAFSIYNAVPVIDGVIFDARSVIISLASLFGGAIVAVTSSIIAGVYRLIVGGDGAFIGVLSIITSSLCGLALHYLVRKKKGITINWQSLGIMALLVHTFLFLEYQFLPLQALNAINTVILPTMFLAFVPATILFGLVMKSFEDQKVAHETLIKTDLQRQRALKNIIRALLAALESRDPYTAGHSQNVANFSLKIAERLGLDEQRLIGLELGALVHDIGKLKIPSEILTKATRLTNAEIELIREHPDAGVNILRDIKLDWPIQSMIEQHHERLDGSGYPLGLKGEQICFEARIIAVADTFDAMAHDRPYREGLGKEKALAELKRGRGTAYEPLAVDAMFELVKEGQL